MEDKGKKINKRDCFKSTGKCNNKIKVLVQYVANERTNHVLKVLIKTRNKIYIIIRSKRNRKSRTYKFWGHKA